MFDDVSAHAVAAEASGFDSVWVMDHFWQLPALGGPGRTDPRGVHAARRARGAYRAGAARHARHRRDVPEPGAARQDRHDPRRHLEGPRRARHRRRVVRAPSTTASASTSRRTRERMDRLEEAVQICRAMFRDEHPSFDGSLLPHRRGAQRAAPDPSGRAADHDRRRAARRRTLRLVAQYADMCNVTGGPDTLAHKLDVLREHCTDVGRDPGRDHDDTAWARSCSRPIADETARVRSFLSGLMGDELRRAVHRRRARRGRPRRSSALVATGVDCLIFNMPLSDADAVRRAGELLVANFA